MKKIFNKIIDDFFEVGVIIKLFFGFFEVLTGTILAISGKLIVNNLVIFLTQQEISEDPNDFFANSLIQISNGISSSLHVFAIVYLIFHGVVNIFLGAFLLKGKLWAYPAAIGVFFPFLIYQIYRYFHTHSLALIFLSIFDAFVMWIIFMEYNKKIAKLNKPV